MRQEADLARERLAQDLNRLEYRVEALADRRTWFKKNPAAFLGAAFGCALLLAFMLVPSRRHA